MADDQTMTVNPVSRSAASLALEREFLVLKKHQDVARDVSQSLVALVTAAPAPAPAAPAEPAPAPRPGRIDTYA